MFCPILEIKDNVTTIKNCDICKGVALLKSESNEKWSFFIGDHVISVCATIIKGECPRCGEKWEAEDAKSCRNDAFMKAIDDFWKSQLDALEIKDEEMASVMFVVSRLMMKVGQNKTRQVAAELGRWLAGCSFLC